MNQSYPNLCTDGANSWRAKYNKIKNYNMEDVEHVKLPDEFPFPLKPYDIQVDFMKNLYKTLELGKIGIFESPTGTVRDDSCNS